MKKLLTFLLLLVGVLFAVAQAAPLQLEIYNPQDKAIFPVTSVLISGDKEIALIDAQFEKKDAQALVEKINKSGKKLTTIFISNSDPDYYFGLDVLKQHFPQAKIVATKEIVAIINASKDSKFAYWAPKMNGQEPQTIIVPEAIEQNYFTVDGQKIEIKQTAEDPDHILLWIPSLKTVLGGDAVNDTKGHLWLADSIYPGSLELWVKKLDEIIALNPKQVIPGHFLGKSDYSLTAVQQTKDYLKQAIKALKVSTTSGEFVQKMKTAFPQLAGDDTLQFGAKVLKGEINWPVFTSKHLTGKISR